MADSIDVKHAVPPHRRITLNSADGGSLRQRPHEAIARELATA